MPAATTESEPTERLSPCQGCGGRNIPGRLTCDWCGRPLTAKRPRARTRLLLAALVLLLVLAGLLALLFDVARPSLLR